MKIREFAGQLNIETCKQISEDYTDFERTGMIGETALRCAVENFAAANKHGENMFHVFADMLVKEIWRRFALEAMKDL